MATYQNPGPTRDEVDALQGATLLEFGTPWCGYCQGAAEAIHAVVQQFPAVQHVKVEDGPGRALGRSFRVKLWPTLVVLKDGVEVARVVRPGGAEVVQAALEHAI